MGRVSRRRGTALTSLLGVQSPRWDAERPLSAVRVPSAAVNPSRAFLAVVALSKRRRARGPAGNSANISWHSEGAAAAVGGPFVAAGEYKILKFTRFYTHLCAEFIYPLI